MDVAMVRRRMLGSEKRMKEMNRSILPAWVEERSQNAGSYSKRRKETSDEVCQGGNSHEGRREEMLFCFQRMLISNAG
jgi:hypothetical protein